MSAQFRFCGERSFGYEAIKRCLRFAVVSHYLQLELEDFRKIAVGRKCSCFLGGHKQSMNFGIVLFAVWPEIIICNVFVKINIVEVVKPIYSGQLFFKRVDYF